VWLAKPAAQRAYDGHLAGFTRAQVVASLEQLDRTVSEARDDAELSRLVRSRFRAFESVGCDGAGTVLFTGYFTPIFEARLRPDARFRFPIHRRPADLVSTGTPGQADTTVALRRRADGTTEAYPDRATIEAEDLLKGQELAWFDDAFAPYLVQIQGSAKLRLEDGRVMEVGYHGTNGHPYRGIGQELVKDGCIPAGELSYARMVAWFRAHPEQVPTYTRRNPRYVFFQEAKGGPFGSLGQRVEPDISLATDKAIFPPGAPVLAATRMIVPPGQDPAAYAALRLDQDTGGAIRAPGRCDLYMGEGDENGRRAGAQYAEGRLYYLIARDAAP
jgi:membrane-bound lytic murein transglycosylase A